MPAYSDSAYWYKREAMKNNKRKSSGSVASPPRPSSSSVSASSINNTYNMSQQTAAPVGGFVGETGTNTAAAAVTAAAVSALQANPTAAQQLLPGMTMPTPGTEDVLDALEQNINFLAQTMQNQGQNSEADMARLNALRSTLQQTKDLHAQNERQRIDTFLTMSAVQAGAAGPISTSSAAPAGHHVNLPQAQTDDSAANNIATNGGRADTSAADASSSTNKSTNTNAASSTDTNTDNKSETNAAGTNDNMNAAAASSVAVPTQPEMYQPKLEPELEALLSPTGFLDCPAMSQQEEERELKSLSESDFYKAYGDIYGHKPPKLAQVEDLLIAVDMELSRLPREDAAAINAARDALPLLCLSSRHIMLFLQNEDFDPPRAALRMARFWTERIELYGDAAFNITSNISLPTEDDLLRMYNRSYDVVDSRDPTMHEENRSMAKAFLDRFEGCMVDAIRNEINSYPDTKKESYLKAVDSCPDRVEELYLDFLRCTNFSIKSSAERMINYYHFYDKLFGPSAVDNATGEFLPIVQMSMGDRAIDDLELGFCRLIPNANDNYGRPIIYFDFSYLEEGSYTMMGALKSVFYVANVLAQDENTLKYGVVLIENHRDCEPMHYNFQMLKQAVSLLSYCLPLQIKVTHSLRPTEGMPEWQTHIVKKLEYLAGRVSRFRVVPHYCSLEDFIDTAEDVYGISRENLPEEIGGEATLDSWREWLAIRADLEDMGEIE